MQTFLPEAGAHRPLIFPEALSVKVGLRASWDGQGLLTYALQVSKQGLEGRHEEGEGIAALEHTDLRISTLPVRAGCFGQAPQYAQLQLLTSQGKRPVPTFHNGFCEDQS